MACRQGRGGREGAFDVVQHRAEAGRYPGQTQSRFQSSAEARIQGQHSTCRSGDNAWHWPDSPAQGDFAFALGRYHNCLTPLG